MTSHLDNPLVARGVARIKAKYPQTFAVADPAIGHHLIIVPTVMLPSGYTETVCTLLFVAPPGFPGAVPADFYTDIEVRRKINGYDQAPYHTFAWRDLPWAQDCGNFYYKSWPEWSRSMWWKLRLQAWHPNRDDLFTYFAACRRSISLRAEFSSDGSPQSNNPQPKGPER